MRHMKTGAVIMAILLVVSLFPFGIAVAENELDEPADLPEQTEIVSDAPGYNQYLKQHEGTDFAGEVIEVKAKDFSGYEGTGIEALTSFEGRSDVLKWETGGTVKWDIEVQRAGFYALKMDYYPLPGKGSDIEMALYINGELPFAQARLFSLRRTWVDNGDVRKDKKGNQISPEQIESPRWSEDVFTDKQDYITGALKVYLSEGKNSVSLSLEQEELVLDKLTFFAPEPVKSYESLDLTLPDMSGSSEVLYTQGENAALKSSMMLHSVYDKSSAATMPSDPTKVQQNAIGGETWNQPGQRITWEIDVPYDGYYKLAFRVQQNYLRGLFVTRNLLIDGKPPFSEAEQVQFNYQAGWYMKTLGDEDPYLFYFEKGLHTLSLETTMGDLSSTAGVISEAVNSLNNIYRRIMMITGTSPDLLRDYMLEVQIPDMLEVFKENAAILRAESDRIKELTGTSGSEISLLLRIEEQLNSFVKNPDTIAERLQGFAGNISSLGTVLLTLKQQALKIDYFMLVPKDTPVPSGKAGFWESFKYSAQMFFNSFVSDYDNMSADSADKDSISVWISMDALMNSANQGSQNTSGGRDQAQILKMLVDEKFTPEHEIDVTLGMVQNALVNSVLAGKAPDVALMVSNELPVNLSMRGGLVALSDFEDYEETAARFFPSAMTPYYYKGKSYALPEIQNFNMMFYRKDILDSLGLKPPSTWDDLFGMLPVLQRNNMNFGIPVDQQIFESVLFQYGLSFYNEGMTKTSFDSPEALKAFKFWTDFYTKYSIPQQYDFYNRFRTGEMPIGIAVYNMYNMFSVAAPELQGRWQMTTIPGFKREDGTTSIAESASGLACIILNSTKNKEGAWEFIKWWTDAPIQSKYGLEMEALLGSGGRYNTANVEAFKSLPWSQGEQEILLKQWESIENNPQVPGNYFISRNINNAFRKVVNEYANPRETLNKYNKYMNDELYRKQQEFS